MKKGWLDVDPDVVDDDALAFWLEAALTFNKHLD